MTAITSLILACPLMIAAEIPADATDPADAPPTPPPVNLIWDVGLLERFDPTNTRHPMRDGNVIVELRDNAALCPTGLGHLASGRDSVAQITFKYTIQTPGTYHLHVLWSPGGSGAEQFRITLDAQPPQSTPVVDGAKHPYMTQTSVFSLHHTAGDHTLRLRHLFGDGLQFQRLSLADTDITQRLPQTLNPRLKFPTLKSYETEIREPGVLLDAQHIRIYAPAKKAREAKIIAGYLNHAYLELYRIVGMHTQYKIVIYHFPADNPHHIGGTSDCTIWYGYDNLNLNSQTEWQRHRVPHVSGYIEEMSHNFAPLATFGWEMIGWHVSTIAADKVAPNPIMRKHIADTRHVQAETFARYRKLGNTFPHDLPPNLCDRIHAHILWQCQQRYGPNFWTDFHAELRAIYSQLQSAAHQSDPDKTRDRRYALTLDCLARLDERTRLLHPTRTFKQMLQHHGISLTRDVKSLNPTNEQWNRKLH